MDPAGHVNNSHYWVPLEEELAAGPEPDSIDAEVEYRDPAEAGEAVLLRHGSSLWIAAADGSLHASLDQGLTAVAARALGAVGGAGVLGDRVDDLRPGAAGQVVAHALDHHQPRARGSPSAVARPPEGRIILSTVPWMTRVGALIRPSAGCGRRRR